MADDCLYRERASSNGTEALFLALTLLFLALLAWRVSSGRRDALAAASLFFFALFLFYSVNYRALTIRLTSAALTLTFGVFAWKVRWDNVKPIVLMTSRCGCGWGAQAYTL